MNLITRDELKQKIDQGEEFKLVMTMGEFAFQAAHIPGSISISRNEDALKQLAKQDEIVVYCAGVSCPASIAAYHFLTQAGYENVRRYAGGLEEWVDAGYLLVKGTG